MSKKTSFKFLKINSMVRNQTIKKYQRKIIKKLKI